MSGSLTKPLLDRLVETLATECQLRAEAEALAADLAERIYGWRAEEVLRRLDPTPAPPDPNPASPDAVTVTDGAAAPESSQHVRSDGSTVYVEIASAALTAPDGSTTGAIKVITDVTRRKELEAEQLHRRSAWVRRMRRRQRGAPRG